MTRWLPTVSAAVIVLAMVAIVARDYPLVGHDYRYFVPRLIDTDLHLRVNGPSIQWYTPSFGGGLPAFPNPQHVQYSPIQLLTLVIDPWNAILLAAVLVNLAGFLCFYRFARSNLGLAPPSAALGAIFFIGNGFSIERLIVGHVGFHLFPLSALVLWVLVDRRWSDLTRGAIAGLAIAVTMYQAGFFLLIVMALTVALCLPLVEILRAGAIDVRRVFRASSVAIVFGMLISAPKIVAALMLMRQFPRQIADQPSGSLLHGLAGLAAQLAGVETLTPLLAIANVDVARVHGVFLRFIGGDFGLWELDAGVSPILFVCLAIGGWSALTAWRKGETTGLGPSQRIALLCLAIAGWIVVESALARGLIYPLLKTLPVFNALHVNPRLAGAFILPLSIVAAALVDRVLRRPGRDFLAFALIVASWLAPLSYYALPARLHFRNFDVSRSLADYDAVRQGERFRIDKLAAIDDADAFSNHASSLLPYDPLLGYGNELFKPQAHAGEVRAVEDGYRNMTNPASLVFAEANGLSPFERIRESDLDRLEQFVRRRQPDWQRPALLNALVAVGLIAALLCVLTIVMGLRGKARAAD
jgi:hypothetical protein